MEDDTQKLLDGLAQAPDSQIDISITERVAKITTAKEMKQILDECAYASLASDFAMATMHNVWLIMLEREKTQEK